jgi:hypothetical protein
MPFDIRSTRIPRNRDGDHTSQRVSEVLPSIETKETAMTTKTKSAFAAAILSLAVLPSASQAFAQDCLAKYDAVWQTFGGAGPFRVKMKTFASNPGGMLKVETPRRLHLDVGPLVSGFLIYDGRIWTGKDDRWTELPPAMEPSLRQRLASYLAADPHQRLGNLACSAEELSGAPHLRFTYDPSDPANGRQGRATVNLYVDVTSNLPVRREITLSDGTTPAHVDSIAYDNSIKIVPPGMK